MATKTVHDAGQMNTVARIGKQMRKAGPIHSTGNVSTKGAKMTKNPVHNSKTDGESKNN